MIEGIDFAAGMILMLFAGIVIGAAAVGVGFLAWHYLGPVPTLAGVAGVVLFLMGISIGGRF